MRTGLENAIDCTPCLGVESDVTAIPLAPHESGRRAAIDTGRAVAFRRRCIFSSEPLDDRGEMVGWISYAGVERIRIERRQHVEAIPDMQAYAFAKKALDRRHDTGS